MLLDMVRLMMTQVTLPIILWGFALQIAANILNHLPTMKVDKTPFEIWNGKPPSLAHLHIGKSFDYSATFR